MCQRSSGRNGALIEVQPQVSVLSSSDEIHSASAQNLSHALNYALLCLPEKFTEYDLFMVICLHMVALCAGIR